MNTSDDLPGLEGLDPAVTEICMCCPVFLPGIFRIRYLDFKDVPRATELQLDIYGGCPYRDQVSGGYNVLRDEVVIETNCAISQTAVCQENLIELLGRKGAHDVIVEYWDVMANRDLISKRGIMKEGGI